MWERSHAFEKASQSAFHWDPEEKLQCARKVNGDKRRIHYLLRQLAQLKMRT